MYGVRAVAALASMNLRRWRGKWECADCREGEAYRFSHLVGTIFENTNKPLREWFRVIHIMLSSKKGVSALQVKRYLGFGSYETAWTMCHKIRVLRAHRRRTLSHLAR